MKIKSSQGSDAPGVVSTDNDSMATASIYFEGGEDRDIQLDASTLEAPSISVSEIARQDSIIPLSTGIPTYVYDPSYQADDAPFGTIPSFDDASNVSSIGSSFFRAFEEIDIETAPRPEKPLKKNKMKMKEIIPRDFFPKKKMKETKDTNPTVLRNKRKRLVLVLVCAVLAITIGSVIIAIVLNKDASSKNNAAAFSPQDPIDTGTGSGGGETPVVPKPESGGGETPVVPKPPPSTPAMALSPAPTPAPTTVSSSIQAMILSSLPESRADVFTNPDSPQSKALNWLAGEGGVSSYPDEKILSRFALASLYYSTGGEEWSEQSGFLRSLHVCLWSTEKIKCNEGGQLVSLSLRSNGLTGKVPFEELSLLTNMTSLDLSGNQLSGSLSSSIGLMSALEQFNVADNPNLAGTLPTEIGLLSNLVSLEIISMAITSTLPSEIGMLSRLESIVSIRSKLQGPLPTELGLMPNLRVLDIQDTPIDFSLPSELGDVNTLELLRVTGTSLTGSIPTTIYSIENLASVVIEGNLMSGVLASELGFATNLKDFRVSFSGLGGTIPTTIGQLSELIVFSLSSSSMSGKLPSEIGLLKNLESLSIPASGLTGSIPTELSSIRHLETIVLSDNSLTKHIPRGMRRMNNLEYLILSGNDFSGTFPTQFTELSGLELLHVGGNDVSGSVPQNLCTDIPLGGIIVDCDDVSCGCCVCSEDLSK